MKLKLRTTIWRWLLSIFVIFLAFALGGLWIYAITYINTVLTDPHILAHVPELTLF